MVNPEGFFGYGSLVNTATHDHKVMGRFCLRGWRRVWQQSSRREVAFLSVEPDPNSTIDGLLATVHHDAWAALDDREFSYNRVILEPSTLTPTLSSQFVIYQASPVYCHSPVTPQPILLSYLDCVIQGYAMHFGLDGVTRFFKSTVGWDTPVLNDRHAPQYSRSGDVSAEIQQIVDAHLRQLPSRITDAQTE